MFAPVSRREDTRLAAKMLHKIFAGARQVTWVNYASEIMRILNHELVLCSEFCM